MHLPRSTSPHNEQGTPVVTGDSALAKGAVRALDGPMPPPPPGFADSHGTPAVAQGNTRVKNYNKVDPVVALYQEWTGPLRERVAKRIEDTVYWRNEAFQLGCLVAAPECPQHPLQEILDIKLNRGEDEPWKAYFFRLERLDEDLKCGPEFWRNFTLDYLGISMTKREILLSVQETGAKGVMWLPDKGAWVTPKGKRLRAASMSSLVADGWLQVSRLGVQDGNANDYGKHHFTAVFTPKATKFFTVGQGN